uniref:Uncharacterized protein n=1 Tax=Lepeophtheirus salmonis TaxID=72036 RepID=A0A0K2V2Y8_LEPSM
MPVRSSRSIKNHHDYKDAVIVGNGPSGITLSYMLSGNIPYYKGKSADEYLHLRLQEESDNPLVLQNLEFLSEVHLISRAEETFTNLLLYFLGPSRSFQQSRFVVVRRFGPS